jgi:hypothetical protein
LAIPKVVKRKFFQLAAMLEMADEGFSSIKQTLTQYENEVGEAISTTPETVEIDATSIREYLNTSLVLKSCEEKICKQLNMSLMDFPDDYPEIDAVQLRMVGLRTVNELDDFLKNNSDIVAALVAHRLVGYSEVESLLRGISLLYVCYVILARKGMIDEFIKFYEENGFGTGSETYEESAKKIIDFVSKFDSSATA